MNPSSNDKKIRVVRAGEASRTTEQTTGMSRLAGIDAATAEATRIWLGVVTNVPGANSGPHHHGDSETAGYLVKGHIRIYFGDAYRKFIDLNPGDFIGHSLVGAPEHGSRARPWRHQWRALCSVQNQPGEKTTDWASNSAGKVSRGSFSRPA